MKCISIFKCKPQIEVIDKSHCNLEDVPNFQSYSRSLEELFLDANKLTLLNENVFRLTKLRRFSFSDNGILDIPPDIAKLVNLVELDCSRNRIQIIPEQIKFLRGLQVCDFSGNDIEFLPSGLVQLKNLTLLTLNYCLIRDLPEDIGLLKNLESLELRENEIVTLPASITGLESLKKLDLGRNLISKLPEDIGRLKNLEYLLLDANRLITVPSKIGRLENLQCLDLSKQEIGLEQLPEEISGLTSLTDLHLSENHLQDLPDGIGQLGNLTILKADSNLLSDLNPNIGGCISLQELVLTSNEINKLPSSIGNLTDLRSVNIDDNMLTELPHEIGNLRRLGILSLRDNMLTYLPNEIGQLDSAKVIDLSSNRLEYLPISITALNLNALWLSKNQAQPLPKLQIDELQDGTRVLTCYLLPQINEGYTKEDEINKLGDQGDTNQQQRNPAVSFDAALADDAENGLNDQNFVRHDTPHPRELRARHQKLFNNGLNDDPQQQQQEQPNLNQLKGHDNEGFNIHAAENNSHLNNHMKQQPYDYGYESNGLPEIMPINNRQQQTTATNSHDDPSSRRVPRHTSFNNNNLNNNNNHQVDYKQLDEQQQNQLASNNNNIANDNGCYVIDFIVQRLKHHRPGLGLSIAGGKDTPPFKDNDEGIFVSKITQGGPAEAVGVQVGDKILAVNNNHFYEGITHHEAVEIFRCLKPDCPQFTMRVLRDYNVPTTNNMGFADDQQQQQQQPSVSQSIENSPHQPITTTRPITPPKPSKQQLQANLNTDNNHKNFDPNSSSRNYTIPIQSENDAKQKLVAASNRGSSLPRTSQEKSSVSLRNEPATQNTIIHTTLIKDYKHELGIELESRSDPEESNYNSSQRLSGNSSIIIADILPDSVASRDGKLQIDDVLLSINGTDVTGIDLHRVKLMLNSTDRFIRIVVSRGDLNDPIGAALRNVPMKPTLGSWFSSTSNVGNRPSLIESYQRPTFGSVTNLQNNNNNTSLTSSNNHDTSSVLNQSPPKVIPTPNNASGSSSSKKSPKPPKPPKPIHLLATEVELESSQGSESPGRDLQSPLYHDESSPVPRPRPDQRTSLSGPTDDQSMQSQQVNEDAAAHLSDEQAKRAAWRKERFKSIDDDVQMAQILAELHRRRNEDRN